MAWVEDRGDWFVARVPEGPIHWLQGSAAVVWDELPADEGDRTGLVERVARRVGLSEDDVRADVEDFVARLVALGLVEPFGPLTR